MSKNGGYKIVDCKGMELTAGEATPIYGTYEAIESAYNKPILLSGVNVGGSYWPDVWAAFKVSGTDFVATIPGYGTVSVSGDDNVTVTNA